MTEARQLLGTKVVECEHPYQNNQDVRTPVNFKGADQYTLQFDAACSSEAGMDFLEVKAKGDTGGDPAFSGKFSGVVGAWPAATETKEIKAQSLDLLWHTDASGVDWGFKVTIKGYRSLKLETTAAASLLDDLLRTVGRVVALGCRQLIMGEVRSGWGACG